MPVLDTKRIVAARVRKVIDDLNIALDQAHNLELSVVLQYRSPDDDWAILLNHAQEKTLRVSSVSYTPPPETL